MTRIDPRFFAQMERAAADPVLAGLKLTFGTTATTAILEQDADALDGITLDLARIAETVLPTWALEGARLGLYRRQIRPGLPTLTNNLSGSLRVLQLRGIPFKVTQEHLEDLMKKRGLYAGCRVMGVQMINAGMDQRQITGAFLVFVLDRLVGALDRRFKDPGLPVADKDRLLDDFAPALIELDDVLRNPIERKEELAAKRKALGQEAADAAADALLAEVSMRLRHNLVVPREALFAAARRHQQKKQQQAGPTVLADTPPPPPGPRTPRRIIE
jgi:hypothetical protein